MMRPGKKFICLHRAIYFRINIVVHLKSSFLDFLNTDACEEYLVERWKFLGNSQYGYLIEKYENDHCHIGDMDITSM